MLCPSSLGLSIRKACILVSLSRTAYWVANKLNELGVRLPYRIAWSPKTVTKIAGRRCYTGKAEYNINDRVSQSRKSP